MELRLLGPVEAWEGARRLELGPRKQRFVLAVLALEANSTVTVDRLVQLAWPVNPPRTAAHAVRVCVSGLRAALAGIGDVELARHGHGYALLIDPARVDVHRFRDLLADARVEPRDDRRVAILTEALALWAGPPLAGVAPAESRGQLCQGIEEARLSAVEERNDALLRLGQHRDLVDELIGLVTAYPLRQRFVGQLMLALHRSGQTGEALARYRGLRARLVEELGLDPGPDLQQLERAILRGEREADAPPPQRAVTPVPRELPPDVYAFAGRTKAMSALDGFLAEPPAIALVTGTGGVGKTALAVHWGHRVADRFPDGQLYLDLRGFHPDQPIAPEEALATLLAALGVSGQDLPTDRAALVGRYRTLLADRKVLLVLDNARDAEQVRPLLPGAGSCAAIVTSRDSLAGLVARDGARRVRLEVLPPQDARDLLRSLIGDRVDDEPEAAGVLVDRCARLPLALRIAAELAAARPDVRLADLAEGLGSERVGLDLLDAGGDRATAVRAVFSWSERHLPDPAVRLFWLLGLSPGPDIDSDALAALAGTDPDEARGLVEVLGRAHLVDRIAADRWTMHDLLRAYARQRAAGERAAANRRLYGYYVERTEAAMDAVFPEDRDTAPRPDADEVAAAKAWLDGQRHNLVAAIRAAGGEVAGHAIRLTRAFARYLQIGYHVQDEFTVYRKAFELSIVESDESAQAMALRGIGQAYGRSGRYTEATEHHRRALDLFRRLGDLAGQAATHNDLGTAAMQLGRYPQALAQYGRTLAISRETGQEAGIGRSLGNIGRILWIQGRYEDAMRHFAEAAGIHKATGNRSGQGRDLNSVGNAHQRLRRYDEAAECHEQALRILRDVGDRAAEACALTDLGRIHSIQGRHAEAFDHHRQALALFRLIGDRVGEAEVLVDLGDAYGRLGRHEEAESHHARAHVLADEIGDRVTVANALNGQGRALGALDRPTEALAVHQAAVKHAADVGDRYCQARALHGMADAHEAAGQHAEAREHRVRALAIYAELAVPDAAELRDYIS